MGYFPEKSVEEDPILRYLIPNTNLPEHLIAIADYCGGLAQRMLDRVPRSAERTAGFRKLLEAKDCFVRAALNNG